MKNGRTYGSSNTHLKLTPEAESIYSDSDLTIYEVIHDGFYTYDVWENGSKVRMDIPASEINQFIIEYGEV